MRRLGSGFLCLLIAFMASPLMAQSSDTQATMVFDINLEKIVNSPLGKELDLKSKMAMIPEPDMTKCTRVFGASTIPADMQALQALQFGNMEGIDFFVQFGFQDADGAKSMMVQPMEENDGVVEKDGKKYYKAPVAKGAPEGVMIVQAADKKVEIGSEAMLYRSNDMPFTGPLKTGYEKAGDNAIRIVMDLETNATLVEDIIETAKAEGGNPMVGEMVSIIKKMKTLAILIDFNNKNLVTVQSIAKSPETAKDIKEAMDSLKFIAQTGLKAQAAQIKQMDPDAAKMATTVADSMSVAASGSQVSFVVPRPEGFEKTVGKAVGQMMMMMGGMGGPPSDF